MRSVLASEGAFSWLGMLPFLQGEGAQYGPLAHSFLVCGILLFGAVVARIGFGPAVARVRAGDAREALLPDAKVTVRGAFDFYVESMLNFMRSVLGHEADRYFPLIAGIFLYVLVSNLLGLIPGVMPPTDSLNTNLPLGLTIFFVYNAAGIRAHGLIGYLKHFLGPVALLAPLVFGIELFSHCVRPATLSIRLWANIFADHIVLDTFMNTLPDTVAAVLGIGVPVIFLGLGLFVCFIQAFVFSLLSMVYIALAVAHDH